MPWADLRPPTCCRSGIRSSSASPSSGEPVRLSLIERAVLMGGNRGAGKSNALNVFVAHVGQVPRRGPAAHRRQPGPARHLAGPGAGVRGRGPRRRPGRPAAGPGRDGAPPRPVRRPARLARSPSPRIWRQSMGIRPWVLVVDELAYHCSVAGTGAQQKAFYAILRDIVARGRAAGIIPIVATQRPTHDLIPTSLRDLFDIRIAFRTMTRTSLGRDPGRRLRQTRLLRHRHRPQRPRRVPAAGRRHRPRSA